MKNRASYRRLALTLAGLHFLVVALAFAGGIAAVALLGTYKDGPNVVADVCFFIWYGLLFPSWPLIEWLGAMGSGMGLVIAPVHSMVFGLVTAGVIQLLRNRRAGSLST